MADPKLVKILRQGSEAWNRWREKSQATVWSLRVDLSGANLSGVDLSGANLSRIDLSQADLSGANLSRTDLSQADLSGANLMEANLRESHLCRIDDDSLAPQPTMLDNANLHGADLSGAYLSDVQFAGANLSNANLNGAYLGCALLPYANLRRASLRNANLSTTYLDHVDLSGAIIGRTIFDQIDLRSVKGLATIEHKKFSNVNLTTVQLPPDGSALHFLRGVGVPDEWIAFYQSTRMHPIQYHSCFISYAHDNDDLARRLHSDLQDHGVRCWFAPHDMRIGDKIRSRIDEAIHLQDKLLLILSEHSVASDWVEHEVETALAREHRDRRTILFPIRLDDAILERPHIGWPALVQNERHIGDFTGWKDHDRYQTAFDCLLRDLKKADEQRT